MKFLRFIFVKLNINFIFRFIHDRVQEAFYENMEESERIQYHIAAAEYFTSVSNVDLNLVPQV